MRTRSVVFPAPGPDIMFNDRTPREILDIDAEAVFGQIGLREHLTAQRSNGLRALVDRIKADADALHATT